MRASRTKAANDARWGNPDRVQTLMAFAATLEWRPIAKYEKSEAPDVLLRWGDHFEFGSWRDPEYFPREFEERGESVAATWRSSRDIALDNEIRFEPEQSRSCRRMMRSASCSPEPGCREWWIAAYPSLKALTELRSLPWAVRDRKPAAPC